jgi:hypothetical protein
MRSGATSARPTPAQSDGRRRQGCVHCVLRTDGARVPGEARRVFRRVLAMVNSSSCTAISSGQETATRPASISSVSMMTARSSNTGTFCSASPNRRPIRTRCSDKKAFLLSANLRGIAVRIRIHADGRTSPSDQRLASSHFSETTTLPFARPASTYAMASLVDVKGKTRSTTGRMIPSSMSDVISDNWSPLALMNRNE